MRGNVIWIYSSIILLYDTLVAYVQPFYLEIFHTWIQFSVYVVDTIDLCEFIYNYVLHVRITSINVDKSMNYETFHFTRLAYLNELIFASWYAFI